MATFSKTLELQTLRDALGFDIYQMAEALQVEPADVLRAETEPCELTEVYHRRTFDLLVIRYQETHRDRKEIARGFKQRLDRETHLQERYAAIERQEQAQGE